MSLVAWIQAHYIMGMEPLSSLYFDRSLPELCLLMVNIWNGLPAKSL